jgi:TRAP-type mannitol/chloroaromatic compound transport system substrate-binding protein
MRRRTFIRRAGIGTSAFGATVAAPAVVAEPRLRWRMVTTWPRGLAGLGTGASLLAELITSGSGGRLEVEVFGAGEVVPAFEALDAVARGDVEMGHGAPYYWKGRAAATQFIAGVPFGLTAQELNGWLQFGGGQALADEVYAQLGCKFFPSGNTGVQMGGWFGREMGSLQDYKGLRMRIPGLGGAVVEAAGGTAVDLPGGEIVAAFREGMVDAAEWIGPYNDLALGLHESAKLYYYPGWHEPATVLDNFINLAAWDGLAHDLKAVVRAANTAVNQLVLSEFEARNSDALATLVREHDVQVRRFSDDVLNSLGKLAGEIMGDVAAKDPASRRIMESVLAYRRQAVRWSRLSTQSYLAARDLPFTFVNG